MSVATKNAMSKGITEADLAYIAGFVDADGSVALDRMNKGKWRVPCVNITNTDKGILEWIQGYFGGTITPKKTYEDFHTPSYCLNIRYNNALGLLDWIIVYMKHPKKKVRAKFILDNYKKVTVRNGKYSKEQFAEKDRFERQFFSLIGDETPAVSISN